MPLHFAVPPMPALDGVRTALSSATTVDRRRTPALSKASGPLVPEAPLPVHVLDRTASDDGIPRTTLSGWRFLIRDGDGAGAAAVAAAQTLPMGDGWAFAHAVGGPYVLATERSLAQGQLLPGSYQPRLLSVPELYMLTLWLHGDVAADPAEGSPAPDDLLIPLAPAPPGIASHLPQRVADLLPVLILRASPAGPATPAEPTEPTEPLLGSPA